MRTIHLTQSQAKCYLSCRRRYFLEYVENLKPIQETVPFGLGKDYHFCIQNKVGSTDPVINAMYQTYVKSFNINILEHEKEFSIHLGYGVYYHGRIDGIAKDGIVEHKTAKVIKDNYFFRLQADIQISLYLLAQQTNKCIYTVMQKPSIRQRQGELYEEYAERLIKWYDDAKMNEKKVFCKTEYRTKRDIEMAKNDFLKLAREIRNCKIYPRNPMHCWMLPCPYQPLCLDYDVSLVNASFYKKDRTNEELEF